MEPLKIAIMSLQEAKDLQSKLAKENIEIVLNHNDQTCNRGCSITVEVLGFEQDMPIISKIYQENFQKMTEGHNVDWEVVSSVFDNSKDTAICPACAHEFSTSLSECPDCGLCLG